MAVRRSRTIDRAQQVEIADDRRRAQVEDFEHGLLDALVGEHPGAESLHEDTDGMRLADRVSHLHLAALGQTRGHDVLGHPAHGVRRGPVDLGRVLAGEGAPAMSCHTAVGVDDDLATRESGIAHGSAHLEAPGGVDQKPVAIARQVGALEDRLDDVLAHLGRELALEVNVLGVLARHDDGVDAHRLTGLVVFDGDLGLAVGSQIGDGAVLAHRRELLRHAMRKRDGQGHERRGLIGGIAEHEALVARTLAVEGVGAVTLTLLDGVIDALRDVW